MDEELKSHVAKEIQDIKIPIKETKKKKKKIVEQWWFLDDQFNKQGPFSPTQMFQWCDTEALPLHIQVSRVRSGPFTPIGQRGASLFRSNSMDSKTGDIEKEIIDTKTTKSKGWKALDRVQERTKLGGIVSQATAEKHAKEVEKAKEEAILAFKEHIQKEESVEKWWFIDDAGIKQGPFSRAQMLHWYHNGHLPNHIRVSKNENDDKLAYVSIREFLEKEAREKANFKIKFLAKRTHQHRIEKQRKEEELREKTRLACEEARRIAILEAKARALQEAKALAQIRAATESAHKDVIQKNEKEEKWWFIDDYDNKQGPFPRQQMLDWFEAGHLQEDVEVCAAKDGTYIPIGDFIEEDAEEKELLIKTAVADAVAKFSADNEAKRLAWNINEWYYMDETNDTQGPFEMRKIVSWYRQGALGIHVKVTHDLSVPFIELCRSEYFQEAVRRVVAEEKQRIEEAEKLAEEKRIKEEKEREEKLKMEMERYGESPAGVTEWWFIGQDHRRNGPHSNFQMYQWYKDGLLDANLECSDALDGVYRPLHVLNAKAPSGCTFTKDMEWKRIIEENEEKRRKEEEEKRKIASMPKPATKEELKAAKKRARARAEAAKKQEIDRWKEATLATKRLTKALKRRDKEEGVGSEILSEAVLAKRRKRLLNRTLRLLDKTSTLAKKVKIASPMKQRRLRAKAEAEAKAAAAYEAERLAEIERVQKEEAERKAAEDAAYAAGYLERHIKIGEKMRAMDKRERRRWRRTREADEWYKYEEKRLEEEKEKQRLEELGLIGLNEAELKKREAELKRKREKEKRKMRRQQERRRRKKLKAKMAARLREEGYEDGSRYDSSGKKKPSKKAERAKAARAAVLAARKKQAELDKKAADFAAALAAAERKERGELDSDEEERLGLPPLPPGTVEFTDEQRRVGEKLLKKRAAREKRRLKQRMALLEQQREWNEAAKHHRKDRKSFFRYCSNKLPDEVEWKEGKAGRPPKQDMWRRQVESLEDTEEGGNLKVLCRGLQKNTVVEIRRKRKKLQFDSETLLLFAQGLKYNESLTYADISKTAASMPEELKLIAEALMTNHTLTQLHLNGDHSCRFVHERKVAKGAPEFAELQRSLLKAGKAKAGANKTVFTKREWRAQTDGVTALSEMLKFNTSLVVFAFQNNNLARADRSAQLTDRGLVDLMSGMERNQSITHLDISDNSLLGTSGKFIAKMLCINHVLTSLSLRKTQLYCEGVSSISEALAINSTLLKLDLGDNFIEERGAVALADALSSPQCRIEWLSLHGSRIWSNGCEAIANSLDENRSLRYLDLSKSRCSHEAFGFQPFHVVKLINDEGNVAKDAIRRRADGFEEFARVCSWPDSPLQTLILRDNQMENDEAYIMAAMIRSSPNLTKLDVCDNDIAALGLKALQLALEAPRPPGACDGDDFIIEMDGNTVDVEDIDAQLEIDLAVREGNLLTRQNWSDEDIAACKKLQTLFRTRNASKFIQILVRAVIKKTYDPKTGKYFYENTRTGKISWKKPLLLGNASYEQKLRPWLQEEKDAALLIQKYVFMLFARRKFRKRCAELWIPQLYEAGEKKGKHTGWYVNTEGSAWAHEKGQLIKNPPQPILPERGFH
eukprot:g4220.t1